jgi:hypothetical protein
MTDLSPSERLAALHKLNVDEEIRGARQASDLLVLVILGICAAACFVWVAIVGTAP